MKKDTEMEINSQKLVNLTLDVTHLLINMYQCNKINHDQFKLHTTVKIDLLKHHGYDVQYIEKLL